MNLSRVLNKWHLEEILNIFKTYKFVVIVVFNMPFESGERTELHCTVFVYTYDAFNIINDMMISSQMFYCVF